MKQIIATEQAPAAIGPYSQGTSYGDMVYTSGQLPLVPKTMQFVEGGIKEQARQSLENLKAVLEASVVEGAIRESGAELKTGCSVSAIRDAGHGGYIVETDNGDVEADVVILSLGFKPNTEAFELPKAQNGALLVNEYGATEDAYIHAVGDCAVVHHMALGKPVYVPLATTANKQARMMADKLAGKDTYMAGFLGSSCLRVLDYELACTGVSELLAKEHSLDVKVSTISDKNQTDYYPGQEDIKVKLVYHPETKVLLGGEIVGKKGAVGRINALAVAITAKMTTQQLGYMDFCYAPPFARTWDALNVAGNVAK